jgi:NADPH:quinone reductase-like Zn-dependent oxidoreductase
VRAVVYSRYGTADELRLEQVAEPRARPGELLIRVRAASVNSWDWDMVRGVPWISRVTAPVRPRFRILGADVAGVVTAVGDGVTRFRVGDAVFGDLAESGWGGFAEFATARAAALLPKPARLTFAEAASVPQAGCLAWQAIVRAGRFAAGERALIIGAGGGVGTMGIQLATSRGHVTAVDRRAKLARLADLGADRLVDAAEEDPLAAPGGFDLIVDVVARRPMLAYRRALAPGGRLVVVGGRTRTLAATVAWGALLSLGGRRRLRVLLARANRGLPELAELLETGDLVPVIDSAWPLEAVPEAIRTLAAGDAVGKLVIDVAHGNERD